VAITIQNKENNMANDLNSCSFIGRLGNDPVSKTLPSGDAVTNFSIAVGWKTKEKEGVEWVNCVSFGKLATICAEYLTKGKQVYINGRFKTRTYDKDGQKHYATEISVNDMQMLGSKAESDGNGGRQQAQTQQNSAQNNAEDDIPF
jgi:single-strand DNA-binding protein